MRRRTASRLLLPLHHNLNQPRGEDGEVEGEEPMEVGNDVAQFPYVAKVSPRCR